MMSSVVPPLADACSAFFVVPWHPYPLHSGGALRSFHLIRQLGRFTNTLAFFPSDSNYTDHEVEAALHRDGFSLGVRRVASLDSPRGFFQRLKERLETIVASGRISESVNSTALPLFRSVRSALGQVQPRIVVLTEIESLLCVRVIRRLCPGALIVLDMLNVNHVLQRQYNVSETKSARMNTAYQTVLSKESRLAEMVDYVFACSEDDLSIFRNLNGPSFRGAVIPNGVDTRENEFDHDPAKHQRNEIIYCASLMTRANIDGLLWLCREIWPRVRERDPQAKLSVIGPGNENLRSTHSEWMTRFSFSDEFRDSLHTIRRLASQYAHCELVVAPVEDPGSYELRESHRFHFSRLRRFGTEGW